MPLNSPAPNLHQPIRRPYKDLYGLDYIAAKYHGFRKPPPKAPDLWRHGVLADSRVTVSDLRSLQYWATTRRLEEFMWERGFENVRAIGMPIF